VPERPDPPTLEPRQRWRIAFARDAAGPDQTGTSARAPLEAAIAATGLPVALGRGQGTAARPRVVLAAPLPAGMSGEHELADAFLTERLPRADVWASLAATFPTGHRLVDLHDVWLGAPTLTACLAAADYRVEVTGATPDEVERACAAVLAAPALTRSRTKGEGRVVTYDLRPLLIELSAAPAADGLPAALIRMRLRMTPDGAAGRPDEVVRAVADAGAGELAIVRTVRERLLTVDDLGATERPGPA
jgi:radical SAM-linked protein